MMMIRETDRLDRDVTNQPISRRFLWRQDQVQQVVTYVYRSIDMLPQSAPCKHVGDALVSLPSSIAWHVEVADDNELHAEQHQLIA